MKDRECIHRIQIACLGMDYYRKDHDDDKLLDEYLEFYINVRGIIEEWANT